MPTPIGHTLAGVALTLLSPRLQLHRERLTLLLVIAVANLADIDFVAGYLVGDAAAYHWGATHSLLAAVLIGGMAGGFLGRRAGWRKSGVVLGTAAYGSHIVMDMLLGPGVPEPFGLQLFWPFSDRRFIFPWHVFKMAPAPGASNPIEAFFNPEIIPVIGREIMVILPVAVISWALARRNESRARGKQMACDF